MARYIDADKVSEKLKRYLMPNVDIDGTVTVENAERYFLNLIDKTSTADVVEVVRCQKCKHGDVSTIYLSKDGEEYIGCYCSLKNAVTDVDYYCANGERSDT